MFRGAVTPPNARTRPAMGVGLAVAAATGRQGRCRGAARHRIAARRGI